MLLLPGAVGYLLISCYPLSLNSSHLFTLVPSTTRDSLLYLCREPGSFEYFCKISRPIVSFQMVTLNVILNLLVTHAFKACVPSFDPNVLTIANRQAPSPSRPVLCIRCELSGPFLIIVSIRNSFAHVHEGRLP